MWPIYQTTDVAQACQSKNVHCRWPAYVASMLYFPTDSPPNTGAPVFSKLH